MIVVEPLRSFHNRELFNCGKTALDAYLKHQVNQDIRKKLTACFVCPGDKNIVKGYYTLSSNSILRNEVPEVLLKKLPEGYSNLPVTLIGRLAIDKDFQGKGLGEYLLMNAMERCSDLSKEIGSMAIIVNPIDKDAERFYKQYGFTLLPDSGKMFIPMKSVSQLFA